MPKYRVRIPADVFVTIEAEESEDDEVLMDKVIALCGKHKAGLPTDIADDGVVYLYFEDWDVASVVEPDKQ